MSDTNPVLLITLGPTGSGKSSIPNKVSQILGLSNPDFVEALIDNLVETHQNYKDGVNNFIANRKLKYKKELPDLDDDAINQMLINNFTSEDIDNTIRFFNDTYFATRDKVNCAQTNTNSDSNFITCNVRNDSILEDALNSGKNVIFETTGEYYPGWLFARYKEEIKKNKYQIVFAMNVVEICELIQRNYKRVKESMINFIGTTDATTHAPRLPDMNFNNFRKKIAKILATFNRDVYSAACDDIYADCKLRKFVFDNNNRDGKTLYDSDDINLKDLTVDTILNGYQLNKTTCDKSIGGKRKSRRINKNKQTRKRKSTNNRRRNTRRR